MRDPSRFLWFIGLCLCSLQSAAQVSTINSLRFWTAPDHTRIVFDTSNLLPHHEVFLLKSPRRLVIDIPKARFTGTIPKMPITHPIINRIRSAARNKTDLRVVIDLKEVVKPKSFSLKPNDLYGYRLVVDLFDQRKPNVSTLNAKKQMNSTSGNLRDVVIAIDPGHGGEDPGARGRRYGTLEKDVVLAIAKKLEKLVRNETGMRPFMVRNGDYYLGLRQRIQRARKAKADLFVSIHADAFKNSKARGSSVFTLSGRGASTEAARWLAARENAADLIGGVSLDDKDGVLASVLLDLSQIATKEASQLVAARVFKNLKQIGKVHQTHAQQAGFVVLKSPDIPSILVETAFITNRQEEKKLRSPAHQMRIAKAIFSGIREYFAFQAPPGTRLASKKHVIKRGETLSEIAVRYGVSMKQLLAQNPLTSSNLIRIGQVLQIPTGS